MFLDKLIEKDKQRKSKLKSGESVKTEKNDLYTPITARHCIIAPPDYTLVSIDFKNQEIYLAAVSSGDETMLKPFLPETPSTKITDTGIEYTNPDSDLHLLTAVNVTHSDLFIGQPEHLWSEIATTNFKDKKGSPRQFGKQLNFQVAYLAKPPAIAENCNIELKVAEEWYAKHRSTYPKYHQWTEKNMNLAEARGWIAAECGRIRWCCESNSKASDNATGRIGVNTKIQGLAASVGKLACVYTSRAFEDANNKYGLDAKLISMIHDELLLLVPGDPIYTPKTARDGKLIEEYTATAEGLFYTNIAVECMKKAEEYYLDRLAPGKRYKGLVSYKVGPYWRH